MHSPKDLVALVTAAQFVIDQMDQKMLLPAHLPGFLCVTDREIFLLASVHIAPYGHICEMESVEMILKNRCLQVTLQPDGRYEIPEGTTSSDSNIIYGGAVYAKELITAWVSRASNDPLAEEAVAIMINIVAGLLPRAMIYRTRCSPRGPNYNQYLHLLMDNITRIA